MRVEINTDGKLEIFPSSRTELYAIKHICSYNYWLEQSVTIIDDVFREKVTPITSIDVSEEISIEDIPF